MKHPLTRARPGGGRENYYMFQYLSHIQSSRLAQKRPLALKLGAARQVSGFLVVSTVLSDIIHKMNTNNYALTETQITPPPKRNPRCKKKTRYTEQLPASLLHQLGELVKVSRRKLPKASRCPPTTKVAPRQHEKKVTRVHPKVQSSKLTPLSTNIPN